MATVFSNFMTVFNAGPAVSLYGSPIMSPTTATLCSSDPFFPCISMSFFALSHAPPVFARWYARNIPDTTAPIRRPATAVGPSITPMIIGDAIAMLADFHSSFNDATVAISTHLA